jgi:hypothetical protein
LLELLLQVHHSGPRVTAVGNVLAVSFARLTVQAPTQPAKPWQWILHNQRGFVLERAIRNGTVNVVICRLHFQRATWADGGAAGNNPSVRDA